MKSPKSSNSAPLVFAAAPSFTELLEAVQKNPAAYALEPTSEEAWNNFAQGVDPASLAQLAKIHDPPALKVLAKYSRGVVERLDAAGKVQG